MPLLITLLITLCMLFGIEVEWTHTHLNEKNIIANQQYDTLFYTLEKQLPKNLASVSFNTYSACLVPINPDPNYYSDALRNKTLSGCVTSNQEISMNSIIEDWGDYRYRLTVLGQNKQKTLLILQAVYDNNEIQSWRIVPEA